MDKMNNLEKDALKEQKNAEAIVLRDKIESAADGANNPPAFEGDDLMNLGIQLFDKGAQHALDFGCKGEKDGAEIRSVITGAMESANMEGSEETLFEVLYEEAHENKDNARWFICVQVFRELLKGVLGAICSCLDIREKYSKELQQAKTEFALEEKRARDSGTPMSGTVRKIFLKRIDLLERDLMDRNLALSDPDEEIISLKAAGRDNLLFAAQKEIWIPLHGMHATWHRDLSSLGESRMPVWYTRCVDLPDESVRFDKFEFIEEALEAKEADMDERARGNAAAAKAIGSRMAAKAKARAKARAKAK